MLVLSITNILFEEWKEKKERMSQTLWFEIFEFEANQHIYLYSNVNIWNIIWQ